MPSDHTALVSAIITTYKRPVSILKRAIDSALHQTHQNLEILVVNDAPEDHALASEIEQLIQTYQDPRLTYIAHEKNAGACKARNTGILHSKGEYIALLDDDDEWLPEKIDLQLQGFTDDTVGMVYSPFYNVRTDQTREIAIRGTHSGNLLEDLLWTNCIGGASMPLLKREVFDACGLFDEDLLSSQDYDMWLRVAEKYHINYVGKPLTIRHMQEVSITQNYEKQKQGFYAFSSKHRDLYEKNRKANNYRLNRRVNKWIEQGHYQEAFKVYREALSVRCLSRYNVTEPLKGILKRGRIVLTGG